MPYRDIPTMPSPEPGRARPNSTCAPVASAIGAVAAFVDAWKPETASQLRRAGRSRLARQVLTLPSAAASDIIYTAKQDLPTCSRALAIASASAAAAFAELGELTEAIQAADVAMVMLGMPDAMVLRELVERLEGQRVGTEELMDGNEQIGDVRGNGDLELMDNLKGLCGEMDAKELSLEGFRGWFEGDRPVVIRGSAADWPAVGKWRIKGYLPSRYGHRMVPVEWTDGHGEMEEKFCSLGEVLRMMETSAGNQSVYMAQHQLFDYIPALEQDVEQPMYMQVVGKTRADLMNVWMGTAGSGSKLHFDSADNFLVQVIGEKVVVLVPSEQSNLLYRKSAIDNVSPVDLEQPDLHRYPKFADVRGQIVYLKPGDALYIPAQHWHWVKARTASISVNFWF